MHSSLFASGHDSRFPSIPAGSILFSPIPCRSLQFFSVRPIPSNALPFAAIHFLPADSVRFSSQWSSPMLLNPADSILCFSIPSKAIRSCCSLPILWMSLVSNAFRTVRSNPLPSAAFHFFPVPSIRCNAWHPMPLRCFSIRPLHSNPIRSPSIRFDPAAPAITRP